MGERTCKPPALLPWVLAHFAQVRITAAPLKTPIQAQRLDRWWFKPMLVDVFEFVEWPQNGHLYGTPATWVSAMTESLGRNTSGRSRKASVGTYWENSYR